MSWALGASALGLLLCCFSRGRAARCEESLAGCFKETCFFVRGESCFLGASSFFYLFLQLAEVAKKSFVPATDNSASLMVVFHLYLVSFLSSLFYFLFR